MMNPEITIRISLSPEASQTAAAGPHVAIETATQTLPVPHAASTAGSGQPLPVPDGSGAGPGPAAALPTPLEGLAGLSEDGAATSPYAAGPGSVATSAPVSPEEIDLPPS